MTKAIAPEASFSVAKSKMTANEARLERKRIKREKEEAAKLEELTRIRKAHFEENRYGLYINTRDHNKAITLLATNVKTYQFYLSCNLNVTIGD